MKNYNLLIVGNGFDLGSGYDTSYKTFLESNNCPMPNNFLFQYCSFSYSNRFQSNPDWNGFEKLLCQFLQFINYLFTSNNVEISFSNQVDHGLYEAWSYLNFKIKSKKAIPEEMLRSLYIASSYNKLLVSNVYHNYSFNELPDDIVFRYYADVPISTGLKKDVLKKIVNKINDELIDLEKLLKNHIKNATSIRKSPPSLLIDCHVDRVLSFNYSHTAQDAFNLTDDDVAYVHGDIENEIVLGVEPSMIDEQTFDESSLFDLFFKRFRRIYKNCNSNYNAKIIDKLDFNSVIGIYGHSLDLSDRSILKPLFEKNYQRYDIYCYGNQNEYKIRLSKLIGIDLYEQLRNEGKIQIIEIK